MGGIEFVGDVFFYGGVGLGLGNVFSLDYGG